MEPDQHRPSEPPDRTEPARGPERLPCASSKGMPELRRGDVWSQAWPLIVANAASPILGLSDTAVLGHGGEIVDLGAIALGTLIFNFVYWTFGFLRMSSTGFVAQAAGAGNSQLLVLAVVRPVLLGLVLGVLLVCSQGLIESSALQLLSAGFEEENIAAAYFRARIWGAPAALAGLGATGMLIGLGRSKRVLQLQLFINSLNIGLDVLFVSVFSLGAAGVGLGTAIAEWVGAMATLYVAARELRARHCRLPTWDLVFERQGLARTLRANADIMVRTLAMIFGFSLFVNESAQFGVNMLAANHLLLQLVSLSAFFLDGFAHVAESHVGNALGAGDPQAFRRAMRLTSEAACLCAVGLAAAIFFVGPFVVDALTDLSLVRQLAREFLPQVSCYVLVSFGAFQLDGVFIGAQWTRAMRNTSLLSLAVFYLFSQIVWAKLGNAGLWWAFVSYVAARGLTLALVLRPRINATHWLESPGVAADSQ